MYGSTILQSIHIRNESLLLILKKKKKKLKFLVHRIYLRSMSFGILTTEIDSKQTNFKTATVTLDLDLILRTQTIDNDITANSELHLPQLQPTELDLHRNSTLDLQRYRPSLPYRIQLLHQGIRDLRLARHQNVHLRLVVMTLVEHRQLPVAELDVGVPHA